MFSLSWMVLHLVSAVSLALLIALVLAFTKATILALWTARSDHDNDDDFYLAFKWETGSRALPSNNLPAFVLKAAPPSVPVPSVPYYSLLFPTVFPAFVLKVAPPYSSATASAISPFRITIIINIWSKWANIIIFFSLKNFSPMLPQPQWQKYNLE